MSGHPYVRRDFSMHLLLLYMSDILLHALLALAFVWRDLACISGLCVFPFSCISAVDIPMLF